MRNKEFYHTSVKVNDYPFEKIYLEELSKELIQTIKSFNSSKNIEYKRELSKNIPVEFPKCRFCGKTIINSNFYILVRKKEKYIQIYNPSVYCREIDDKKYYLSCCKDCLLEHFKDNAPKSEKYYFMKANVYGQYCFGYSDEEYKKICSMTVGVTYNSMINKWGKELGEQKWKEYCSKHSKIASKQTFIEKYGKVEGLKIYHESRAITKDGMIKKYGKSLGIEKWNNYCERQRYTCSFEYFIKEYGENIGAEKYKKFSIQRASTNKSGHKISVSKISQNLFVNLHNVLKHYNINNEIYYDSLNNEYIVCNTSNKTYLLDFYDKTKNLIIEFQGDYWHANPNKYKKNDILKFPSTFNESIEIYAEKIWEKDQNRKEIVCKELNNPIYLQVWESDYKENPERIIKEILLLYNIKLEDNYEISN